MKKLTITGYVGRDAELRNDSNGNVYATFSVAVASGTKLDPKVDWIEVSCGGRLVDVAHNYIKKGIKILVDGFPNINAYVNAENQPANSIKVYAHTIELLSRANEANRPNDGTSENEIPAVSQVSTLHGDEIQF